EQLLNGSNNTDADYPRNALLHELIEAQARRTPDAAAIAAGSTLVTYRQLDDGANRLASHLQKLGVTPEMPVAVCAPVRPEMLVAVLAVLKAGGALLTVAGAPSESWNAAVLKRASVVVGEATAAHELVGFSGKFVAIDEPLPGTISLPESSRGTNRSAENLAIIVPSGTAADLHFAGFSHGALVNVLSWLLTKFSVRDAASTLQLKRPGSERFVYELLSTWCSGGRLV